MSDLICLCMSLLMLHASFSTARKILGCLLQSIDRVDRKEGAEKQRRLNLS